MCCPNTPLNPGYGNPGGFSAEECEHKPCIQDLPGDFRKLFLVSVVSIHQEPLSLSSTYTECP